MSVTNKNAVPPTIPGSGKFKSLETDILKIDDNLFVTNITANTITGNTITDGTASMSGGTLSGLNTPVAATDATNKAYVDSLLGGTWLGPVIVASTGNLTLSGLQIVDGVSLVAGDRILVKDQAIPADNGVYDVDVGAWTRSSDLNTGASAGSVILAVNQGTTNQSRIYQCTNFTGSDIVGTDPLTFVQFAGSTGTPGGADTNVQFNNAGSFGGSGNFTWDGTTVDVTGNVVATGTVTCTQLIATSDATLKRDVEPISDPLGKLNLLDPVQYKFNYNDDNQTHYGVLAQDLQEQGLGNIVHEVNGHLAVNYNDILGILIGAVQEIRDEVKELKKRI